MRAAARGLWRTLGVLPVFEHSVAAVAAIQRNARSPNGADHERCAGHCEPREAKVVMLAVGHFL